MSRRAKPAKVKPEAKRPLAGKSSKNAGSEVRDLEKRLAEALEREKAAGEILRVISSSPASVQPTFEAIARAAMSLCEADIGSLFRFDGQLIHVGAFHGTPAETEASRRAFPQRPSHRSVTARAILAATVVQIDDVSKDPEAADALRAFRTVLSVPMIRDGRPLGAITVARRVVRPFSDEQIELLKTFADQAVIAIENVRLFKELEEKNRALTAAHAQVTESLEQQTATSEILGVISRSPTEVQPVFDTIVNSAARLCDAVYSVLVRFDGKVIEPVAAHNWTPVAWDAARRAFPAPPSRAVASGRAILERAVVQVPDVDLDREYANPELRRTVEFRSLLAAPMIRDGEPLGVILVGRATPGPFSDSHIALLKTFADQAVIAIENVRLFKELEARNCDLAATSEILGVISTSPTDVQPVFDAIVASAARLCDAVFSGLWMFDGELMDIVAAHNWTPAAWDAARRTWPARPNRALATSRAILERAVVHIPDVELDREYDAPEMRHAVGFRSILSVPMMRDDKPVGVIAVGRAAPGPFSDGQIALLKTFADQAVIAIENVRLFTELQDKNRALTDAHAQVSESLEQQTATAEILSVISGSPTDVRPVFDAVLDRALTLCEASNGSLYQLEDRALRHVGARGIGAITAVGGVLSLESAPGWAVLEKRTVHIEDVLQELDRMAPEVEAGVRRVGVRTVVAVPLLREQTAIGAIFIRRLEVRPFSEKQIRLLQTFADQAVIAIENVRLFTELQASNRELTTALDKQTATSDILAVISRSQTDVQPVFDAILASAVRLLGAHQGALTRVVGDHIELAASTLPGNEEPALRAAAAEGSHAQVVHERAPVNIADMQTDPRVSEGRRALARAHGYRSLVTVPLLRQDEALGAIAVTRPDPGGFAADEIALLRTFADQAVIAIENVRLFTELEARNRDLTATSQILQVISSSPTDVQPIFEAIVESAARLCDAFYAAVVSFDGELMRLEATRNWTPEAFDVTRRVTHAPPSRAVSTGRAILERAVVHVPDVGRDPEYLPELGHAGGFRSVLAVPMLRDGVPLGAITVGRAEPGPFSDNQIALLKTFADQAVIAIENVRLFKELETRNAELTETLARQTATGEVLRAISRAQTDAQPVFDIIASSAMRLCAANFNAVTLYDGELLHLAALTGGAEALWGAYPRRADGGHAAGRAIQSRAVVHIPDVLADRAYELKDEQQAIGFRSILAVPMLRDGEPIGVLSLGRREPGSFSDNQIDLVETFADQAVIAIENVRLFTELQTSNRDLTTALDTQTATSDILRVISRSQTDVQPVFEAIVQSAVRLLHGYYGAVIRVLGDRLERVATTGAAGAEVPAWTNLQRPLHGESVHAQAIRARAPLNFADVLTDPRVLEELRGIARATGYRSLAVVPLLRQDEALGTIAVTRRAPGGLTDDEIALLQTFADQAVIAIENARLLSELQARTQELTRSVGELTALGEVGRALSSTLDVDVVLDTIVARANDLIGADGCTIFEYDETTEQFYLRATRNLEPRLVALARGTPLRKGDQGILGQLPVRREAVQVSDITDGSYSSPISDALIEAGYRAVVAVPLIREDHLIGALTMNRKTPGAFPPETIELLHTFATQSALAIQNARLFREIEIKSRELEAASQHKSEFLASMSHELRTPLNAIIGFSDVLLAGMFGETNEKQTEYLRDILASGQHLLSLINDILDLSKIEAGRMELELGDFELPAAIDDALLLMRERAGRRGLSVERHVDERLGEVRADQRKVKQVLLNLLSNAVKFTPEGGRIDVRAAIVGGTVEVAVTDTGIGIAPEDQEAVFEEFRQVGKSDKKAEGTGLGLALCRKFVELHGGRIWVKSQVGQGSTFTFTLPVRREPSDRGGAPSLIS